MAAPSNNGQIRRDRQGMEYCRATPKLRSRSWLGEYVHACTSIHNRAQSVPGKMRRAIIDVYHHLNARRWIHRHCQAGSGAWTAQRAGNKRKLRSTTTTDLTTELHVITTSQRQRRLPLRRRSREGRLRQHRHAVTTKNLACGVQRGGISAKRQHKHNKLSPNNLRR